MTASPGTSAANPNCTEKKTTQAATNITSFSIVIQLSEQVSNISGRRWLNHIRIASCRNQGACGGTVRPIVQAHRQTVHTIDQ